jgi:hypothetical protein
LDFEVSLGFLVNVVSLLAGGGVTAGSTVSNPNVFLGRGDIVTKGPMSVVAIVSSESAIYVASSN